MIETVWYLVISVVSVSSAYGAILSRLKALEHSNQETSRALTRVETLLSALPCRTRSPPPECRP